MEKRRGRPGGKIKTSKIEISIEPDLKEEFMRIVHKENNYCSILIREWIIEYISNNKDKRD